METNSALALDGLHAALQHLDPGLDCASLALPALLVRLPVLAARIAADIDLQAKSPSSSSSSINNHIAPASRHHLLLLNSAVDCAFTTLFFLP